MLKRTLIILIAVMWLNTSIAASNDGGYPKAIFAGGCFWCMQAAFDRVPGVIKTTVGYTGGTRPNPTYQLVSSGVTHYAEAIEVYYNPSKTDYNKMLYYFWRNIDPTRDNGQFCDSGYQYRPEIFYTTAAQEKLAIASRDAVEATIKMPIRVKITRAMKFYPAEEYHQKYYQKNPVRYRYYYFRCGRAQRLQQIWGKVTD